MIAKIKNNKYYQIGLTAFLVILACLFSGYLIFNIDKIFGVIGNIISLLVPFIIGFVFAYLLNPVVDFFKEKVYVKFIKNKKTISNLSILTTCVIFLGLIGILFNSIIPALLSSVETLAKNIPSYVMDIKEYLIAKTDSSEIANMINANYATINESINKMLSDLLPKVEDMIGILSTGIFGAIKVIFDLIMGFVISIYFLSDKENFIAGIKKILFSIFSVKFVNRIMDYARHTNEIFNAFIIGKLLDALTIGFITTMFLTIAGFKEYALLIGVTVGITNMIPYFGPYIGTIPSALLILMDEVSGGPKMCLIFIIFIIALQQIDSYVIEPKLCGSKTGLKSFWVLASILFFGNAFGIIGLLLGVPVFALIYGFLDNKITERLEENELPYKTEDYVNLDRINSKTKKIVKLEENK